MKFSWLTPARLNFPRPPDHFAMCSPITALTWEIWQRGRSSAAVVIACLAAGALLNWIIPDPNHALFSTAFGFLMVLSFGFLLGLLNCTEFNSTRDWNGFPYRLFVLPVPTWQLVAVPMLLGLIVVESLYFAWIKLVWTHEQIVMPEWFAVVLGAYLTYYQMTLWSLSGFRILRTMVLGIGGVSGILVAFLPAFGKFYQDPSPWLSEKRLIPIVLTTIPVAFIVAWIAVSRQRHSGGRRRNRVKALVEWLTDHWPRRTKNFPSPAAAQFWYEWRRAGLLLPASMAFALIVMFAPLSSVNRDDPQFTINTLCWLFGTPVVLGFLIGKGFIKPDFMATNLAIPTFLAVRPIPAGEFVIAKLKVAARSVAITWLLVITFLCLWLPLWANTTELNRHMNQFKFFYPHSWQIIAALLVCGFVLLTWRGMVSGLWLGLSGKRLYYAGSICLQIIVPVILSTVLGIFSDDIDRAIDNHHVRTASITLNVVGGLLALAIVVKVWFAALSWRKISVRRTRQYLLIWAMATAVLVILAILARPPMGDFYRADRLYILGALWLVPFARIGAAPFFFEKNRHR
jgi:hypothetical protein